MSENKETMTDAVDEAGDPPIAPDDAQKVFGIALAIVAGFWLASWIAIFWLIPAVDGDAAGWAKRGQFGDLFGAVNSLFSGVAFAALLITIRLQRKQADMQREELKLQRIELALQRQEMKDSRAELATQARATQALYLATMGQIRVAAVQAEIEAEKVKISTGAYLPVEAVRQAAEAITALANNIEHQVTELGGPPPDYRNW